MKSMVNVRGLFYERFLRVFQDWKTEKSTSGWSSLISSWFSTSVFRDGPGTVAESVHLCGLKRNSSNSNRASELKDSVVLDYWDSFSVTLPSISLKTCVIYSSLDLGTDVFRDWPFLRHSSCDSLAKVANFRWFFNVAIFLEGRNAKKAVKTELFVYFYQLLR